MTLKSRSVSVLSAACARVTGTGSSYVMCQRWP
jgi:hypothetical protein